MLYQLSYEEHRTGIRGGHGFESRWSLGFFQASSFQLLKLENLLRWSFFTLIYNRSSIYELFHIYFTSFHSSREIWTQLIGLAPNVWLHSSVGRASHRYSRRLRVRIPLKPWFFQASSFQLLKLENLLRWSFFTLIYNRSSIYELFHIYFTSFHSSREIWTQLIGLAPNVWLHSSVGRASHRYSRRSRVRIPLKPWFFQASSFQLLKLENLLRWSFFTLVFFVIFHYAGERQILMQFQLISTWKKAIE